MNKLTDEQLADKLLDTLRKIRVTSNLLIRQGLEEDSYRLQIEIGRRNKKELIAQGLKHKEKL